MSAGTQAKAGPDRTGWWKCKHSATEDILGKASTSLVSSWRLGLIARFVRLSYRRIVRRLLNIGARKATELVEPRPGVDDPLAADIWTTGTIHSRDSWSSTGQLVEPRRQMNQGTVDPRGQLNHGDIETTYIIEPCEQCNHGTVKPRWQKNSGDSWTTAGIARGQGAKPPISEK